MRKLLCSLAAGAAFLGVTAAVATASTCAGTCTPLTPTSSTATGPINSTFGDGGIPTGTAITDIFPFLVVPPPATWNSASDEITLNAGDISGLTLAIYSGAYPGGTLVAAAGQYLPPPTQIAYLPSPTGTIPLFFGPYYIEVSGTAVGTTSYGGTLSVELPSSTFTPLPGALALFAGGLGLLGFTGLRKRRKNCDARASVAATA